MSIMYQNRARHTFDAVRFADKLNINATKARGMIVAELFTKLSQTI